MILTAGNIKVILEENLLKILSFEGDTLVQMREIKMFLPHFWKQELTIGNIETISEAGKTVIIYTFTEEAPIRECRVYMEEKGRYLQVYCSFTPQRDVTLNAVELFPEGTKMPLYKVINFRNRHCTERTYEDLVMGAEVSTTTYSTDWQFAPHPSMFLFSKKDYHFFVGALDLPRTFGMYLDVDSYVVKRFEESYGEGEDGLLLKAGEQFRSTKYAFFLDYQSDPHETIGRYTDILIREGYIPNPALRKRYDWHRENLYCTWVDQGYLTDTVIPTELHDQIEITLNAAHAVTDKMVRDAVRIIEREKLPFTTILIDMGWSERGEWIANKSQFPDFRKLVDDLHTKGFKVVVWWNWAEVANEARIDSRFLVEGGRLNKHGQRTIDFSNPVTQREYLQPMFHRLFSDEKDCYNVDGVKTDFLSDKVHPEMKLYNPDWRGEEQYFYKVFELFTNEMKRYKEDAVHIGCAGHPYLAEFIDINRTYDVWSTNVEEHVNRGKMLKACSPGTPVAFDFHHFEENLELYFKKAYEEGCSVQIGNIMGIKEHPVAEWHPVGESYYEILRRNLAKLPR